MFACKEIAHPHAAPPPLAESERLRNRLGVATFLKKLPAMVRSHHALGEIPLSNMVSDSPRRHGQWLETGCQRASAADSREARSIAQAIKAGSNTKGG